MVKKLNLLVRIPLILILIVLLVQVNNQSAIAAKKNKAANVSTKKKSKKKSARRAKRVYKPDLTRQQAIDMIINNSSEVSELAGLESGPSDKPHYPADGYDIVEEGEDLQELENEDDVLVDMSTFKMLWLSYVEEDGEDEYMPSGIKKADVMDEIMNWLGTPYHFGGTSNRGIDCSAFVRGIYEGSAGIMLPRTASEQIGAGVSIKRNELQFGDLVFFHTRSRVYVGHVGIYLGDNLFAHSSSRYGVTVSSLESTYYDARFVGARRLTPNDISKLSIRKEL